MDKLSVSVSKLLEKGEKRLRNANLEVPDRQAAWILGHLLGVKRVQLLLAADQIVEIPIVADFFAMIERRVQHEPLQYILGDTDFCGLRIKVNPDVLIPRPETELVVKRAVALLDGKNDARVLDIGTGSGCIALAIKNSLPNVQVVAGDVSEAALAVAMGNAVDLGLDVEFVNFNILSTEISVVGDFSLIVSNPPYIPYSQRDSLMPEVKDYEPDGALFSDADPLQFYRAISRHAKNLLRPAGSLVFEVHADFGRDVQDLLLTHGFTDTFLEKDLTELDRVVGGTWIPV